MIRLLLITGLLLTMQSCLLSVNMTSKSEQLATLCYYGYIKGISIARETLEDDWDIETREELIAKGKELCATIPGYDR